MSHRIRNKKLKTKFSKKKMNSTSNDNRSDNIMNYLLDINYSDAQERKDAIWIDEMRKAKAGLPSRLKWFPILDKDAKKYGLPDIFDKKYIINFKTKGNKNVK